MSEPIIYLHLPKTAGTSIRASLEKQLSSDELLLIYGPITPENIPELRGKAKKAKIIFGHISFGTHELLNIAPRYASVFRSPLDRAVSLYLHHRDNPGTLYYDLLSSGMPIDEFIKSGVSDQTNNHQTRNCTAWPTAMPTFIHEEKYLKRALRMIDENFLFTGTDDHISNFLGKLNTYLDLPAPVNIPQLNRTANQLELSESEKQTVLKYDNLDFILFEEIKSKNV